MSKKIYFGFDNPKRKEIEDFLITPAVVFAHAEVEELGSMAIGLAWGYWAVFVAIRYKRGK